MLEWEWYSDINTTRLFLHCLLKANHKEKKWQGKVIPRGSFITGRNVLADETGLTVQQIRTSISKLKSTNDLTIKATNKNSLVTVVNYGAYQDKELEVTNKTTSNPHNGQPTDNQQVTTTNNDNNNNNDNNKENKPAKLPKFSQDDLNCANWFYGLLKTLNPNHKEPNFNKWADEIRKIVNIDNRSYNEISDLMLWVNQDNFWQTNILSPSKLREKWDQLTIAKNKTKPTNRTQQRTDGNLQAARDFLSE
jgi:hypothetical protein